MTFGRFWILIFCVFIVSSQAFAQCDFLNKSISFSCKKISREAALEKLAQESGFGISYPSNSLKNELITINVKNKPTSQIINIIKGNAKLDYKCLGNKSIVFYVNNDFPILVAGFVRDAKTRMPVSGALIVTGNNWVETDVDGYFLIEVNQKPIHLSFYHPGYEVLADKLEDNESISQIAEWFLEPNADLTEAVINVFDSILFVNRSGGVNINMKEIEKIPSISGSPGILNSLRFIPGLQSTVEVNGGLIVRGGSKDQNLVLYDGMELYNPMHLFGLFSVFGEGTIQGIEFYKHAFPAQFGGRLSSVLNVHGKQGDYKEWNTKLDLNPVLVEATISGPIKKDKTSLLLSGRRSLTDFFPLFYEQIQNQNQLSRFKYFFYDFSGSINHKLSDNSNLYFTNYIGGDKGYIKNKNQKLTTAKVDEENNDEFLQSNLLSTLGWKRWISKTFQIHALVGYTRYQFDHQNRYGLSIEATDQLYQRTAILSYESKISDWKTGVYLKSSGKNSGLYNFGVENVWHSFTPARSTYYLKENDVIPYDTIFDQRSTQTTEQRFYFQYTKSTGPIRLMTGLHFANFNHTVVFRSLQPRINLLYDPNQKSKFELGFAKTTQFIISVPNNILGIPIDIWLPADEYIEPQQCWIYSAGYAHQVYKNIGFRMDLYYKHFDHIKELRSGVVDFVAQWEQALLDGKSRSRGVELLLKKEKGKFNGWLSYALSKTERSIPELNNGAWFPFQFDRRHDFNVVLNYQPNSALSMGCTWTYASGHYITAPESKFAITAEGKNVIIQQYGSKNNLKLPSYHRLDLGVHFKKQIGKIQQIWSFSVYNAYNRQNVYYVNSTINANGSISFKPYSLLPILPSINYSIRF